MAAWTVKPTTAAILPAVTTSPIPMHYTSKPGRSYVVIAAKTSATGEITAVQDDVGNTWTRLDWTPKSGTVGRRIEAWFCTPTTPFTRVEVVHPAFQTLGALIEVTGTNGVVNAVKADFRAAAFVPAPVEITPTKADCLVIGAVMANSNKAADITAGPGWTYLPCHIDGPQMVYRTDAAAGVPVGVDWTFKNSQGSGMVILALEAGASTSGLVVSVWNGTTEQPAVVEGIWDGTAVQPCTFESMT